MNHQDSQLGWRTLLAAPIPAADPPGAEATASPAADASATPIFEPTPPLPERHDHQTPQPQPLVELSVFGRRPHEPAAEDRVRAASIGGQPDAPERGSAASNRDDGAARPDDQTDDEALLLPTVVRTGVRRATGTGHDCGRSNADDTDDEAAESPQDEPPSETEKAERSCGTCSACCISLYIRSLAKPAGEPCSFLRSPTGGGCTIHASRFPICRDFFCMWVRDRRGLLLDSHRPDKLGLILTASTPDETGRQTIHAHEVREHAHMEPEAQSVLMFLSQFAAVEVHPFRDRRRERERVAETAAAVVINPRRGVLTQRLAGLVARPGTTAVARATEPSQPTLRLAGTFEPEQPRFAPPVELPVVETPRARSANLSPKSPATNVVDVGIPTGGV